MHSLVKQNAHEWIVARYEIDNGTTCTYPIFHKLSLPTAMKLVCYLNGGAVEFDELMLKVLLQCTA